MSLLRASLLGAIDGVITSFAIVSGSHAGRFDDTIVIVIGTSSLLADGFSMGVSEFLSSDAVQGTTNMSNERSPWMLGVVCFTAFVAAGFIPLLSFVWSASILSTAMFSLVELMLLGTARAYVTKQPLLLEFTKTTLLGASAGGISFLVGKAVYSSL